MLKTQLKNLNALLDKISEYSPLYMPLEKAGEANYGLYKQGEKPALGVLKTVKSPKDLFFPQSETIVKFKTEGKNISVEDIRKHLDKKMISISAKEQTGMDDLEETIKEMFFSGEVTFNDEVYITNIRHKTSLQEALRSLHLVLQSIADDMPEDFYSIDLMNAYEELGNIIGESVEDDLVNEIFSKFCMGK